MISLTNIRHKFLDKVLKAKDTVSIVSNKTSMIELSFLSKMSIQICSITNHIM